MSTHQFILFALACFMLNITPGNDMLYVISRSSGQGSKAGIVSAFGITAGCMVHILAAIAGLSALLAGSAVAFSIIRYAGAAYLVYLGLRGLLGRNDGRNKESGQGNQLSDSPGKIFLQGLITNLLNPKVALFVLAFLPQFVDFRVPHPYRQFLWLGLWFNFSGTVVNTAVAILFGRLAGLLTRSGKFAKVQSKLSGVLLTALGLKVALGSGLS